MTSLWTFTLAIIGSRDITVPQRDTAKLMIEGAIRVWMYRRPQLRVISGGADGMDKLVEEVALHLPVFFEEFLPTVRRFHGPGGFDERNRRIGDAADELICIRSLQSRTNGAGSAADYFDTLGKGKAVRCWV